MGWSVWFLAVCLGAIGLGLILSLLPNLYLLFKAFMSGLRGEPAVKYRLSPKQEELNRQALIKRKANANKALQDSWTYQFSHLQIEAHKRRLKAQQDNETKEN